MAKSGSKTIAVTDWDSLVFSWSVISQSTTSNSSTISWSLKLVSTAYGAISSSVSKPWSVNVGGISYSGTNSVAISNNSTKTLASGKSVLTHNADGTRSFNYSFSQQFSITFDGKNIGTISGSGSGTLDPIARASQPSCVTWPEHTQNVGNFGATISIHMNRQSASFTHTVRYAFGSASGTIATGVGTGTTWTIPLTLMNLIPNSTQGSGTIFVDTYNGSSLIGTRSCGFTATVPASVVPSFSAAITDITSAQSMYGSFVKGLSRLKITVTPTAAYSSSIVSCSITANGDRVNDRSMITGVLKSAGTNKVVVTVTDARGRTKTTEYSLSVLDYSPPQITKLSAVRVNSSNVEDANGARMKVTFSAVVSALGNKNTAEYTVRYKKSTDTNFTEMRLTSVDNVFTVNDISYRGAADTGSSYDIELVATDNHSSTVRTATVPTAFTLMHFGADGTSIGVGKVAEKANTMEVALDTEFNGITVQKGNSYAFSSAGVASTVGFVLMASIEITGVQADAPITFVFTQRQALQPMTVTLKFQSVATLTPTVQSITYEGDNYDAYASPISDSVWGLYVKKVSAYDNICLQEWWTSSRMDSRIKVTFPGTLVDTVPTPYYKATPAKLRSLLDYIYPVGSIYISYSQVNPSTLFGGTWARIENAFLWGCDADGDIGITGGEKTHTLTVNEMPSHHHGATYTGVAGTKNYAWYTDAGDKVGYVSTNVGGGAAHNNMPPYIQVAIWRRTA